MQVDDRQTILSPGDMLGCYRIERFLGQGGFGVTYVAHDTMLDMQVAIKEYLPESIAQRVENHTVVPRSQDHGEVFSKGLTNFLKEARTLARFKHPNIVRVMSIFELNGTAYMVMEYERGHDLKLLLDRRENITESALKALFGPILNGLEEVHRLGFIHRDIKPANILVRDDGSPVLLDFGSARLATGHQTELLTAMVTSGFAPLEQYSGLDEQQGPWTDIYALGAVLYYAVSAKAPVDSTLRGAAVLNDSVDPLQSLSSLGLENYSHSFCQAVDWALQFKVSARPQTLEQWRSRLFDSADVMNPKVNTATVNSAHSGGATHATDAGHESTKVFTREVTPGVASNRTETLTSDQATRVVNSQEIEQARSRRDDTYEPQQPTLLTEDSQWDVSDVGSRRKNAEGSSGARLYRPKAMFTRARIGIGAAIALIGSFVVFQVWQPGTSSNEPMAQNTGQSSAEGSRLSTPLVDGSTTAPDSAQSLASGLTNTESDELQVPRSVTDVPVDNSQALAGADEQSTTNNDELSAEQQSAAASAQLEADRRVQREEALRQTQIQQQREEEAAAKEALEAQTIRREAARQERIAREAEKIEAQRRADQERDQLIAAQNDAVKPVISGSDMTDVLTRFNGLSLAIRQLDSEALRRYTVESKRKTAYFDYVFRTFETVESRITNISASRQDQTIRATLRVSRMIRANGDIAIPPDEFKEIPIHSVKETQWSAIHW